MTYAVFTGVYRNCEGQSLDEKLNMLNKHGLETHFFSWVDDLSPTDAQMLRGKGVHVHQYDPPFPHVRGIPGRRRQGFLARKAVDHFSGNPRLLKLRWDVKFNEELLENVNKDDFLEPVKDGFLKNKVWCCFYSMQEFFSTPDQSYCGYREDLSKLVQWDYKIRDRSAYDYVAHDGMHLSIPLVSLEPRVCDLLETKPDPVWKLVWEPSHLNCEEHLHAWGYYYYLLDKYFKTGPLGTLYFPRGDSVRWPNNRAIVDYDRFLSNYQTIKTPSPPGYLPKYRVYDDVFVRRVVTGEYQDEFAKKIKAVIDLNRNDWI